MARTERRIGDDYTLFHISPHTSPQIPFAKLFSICSKSVKVSSGNLISVDFRDRFLL